MGLTLAQAPRAARLKPQGVGVVGAIGQQNVATAEGAQHVVGAASVMGLALGDLQRDRQAAGVDQRVDFGGQPAARATHATGSRRLFLGVGSVLMHADRGRVDHLHSPS